MAIDNNIGYLCLEYRDGIDWQGAWENVLGNVYISIRLVVIWENTYIKTQIVNVRFMHYYAT